MGTTQEFFTRQHQRLMNVETSIEKTRTDLDAARTEAMESLQAKRAQAEAAREARHQQITDKTSQMRARMDATRQETAATVDGWKHTREVHKLENRAQDAEAYAEAATAVLELAHEEARAASLEAIEARRDAEAAKVATATAS
jgi:hypothetical protein